MYLSITTDPPVSDGLTDYQYIPAGFLIFTIVATIIFMLIAMALIIFSVALRNHK